MGKDKVLSPYDYFFREIKPLINPGRNSASAIGAKITSVLTNSKRHRWGIEEDINAIREIVLQKITVYNDEELTMWYSDLKAIHDEDTQAVVNKVIDFYIQKNRLTKPEKEFYKSVQQADFMNGDIDLENVHFDNAALEKMINQFDQLEEDKHNGIEYCSVCGHRKLTKTLINTDQLMAKVAKRTSRER